MAQEQKTVSGTVSNTDLPSTQGQEEATPASQAATSTDSPQAGSLVCPCSAELKEIADHWKGIKSEMQKLSLNKEQNNSSGQIARNWWIPFVALVLALVLYVVFVAALLSQGQLQWQHIALAGIVTVALFAALWASVSMTRED